MYKTTWIFLLIGIFAETFVKPVSGVRLSFSKQSVVKQPGNTVLTCGVNENDVGQIFVMQIKVLIRTIMTQLGRVDIDKGLTLTLPESITDRMTVAGSIDKVTPSMSQLTLTIDTEKVQCTDGTVYQCDMTYITNSVDPSSRQSSDNGTLAVFVIPEMLSLEAKHNGENIEAPTPEKKAIFKIGDHLELTCTANVGTIPTTSIQWRRTTEIGKDDLWNEYQPPQGTYTETDAVTDGNCGYTRTSTISYNMTAADANRQNNLAFECYVFVSTPPYSNFRTDNNPRFYIDVAGGSGGNTPTVASAAGGSGGNTPTVASAGSESSKCQTDSADSSSSTKVLIGLVVGEGVTCLCLIAAVAYLIVKNRGVGYKQDRQKVERTEPERNQSTYTDLQRSRPNMEMTYDVLENTNRERNPGYVNALS